MSFTKIFGEIEFIITYKLNCQIKCCFRTSICQMHKLTNSPIVTIDDRSEEKNPFNFPIDHQWIASQIPLLHGM